MYVTRTQQVVLKDDHFSYWCHKAKNVYNNANYIVRQEYFSNGRYIAHNELYHIIKHDQEYRGLPSLVANEVLRTLHEAWRGFFSSMRSYGSDPFRFLGRPRPPRYKDRDGEIMIRFPRNHISHRGGKVLLPKKVGRYPIRHKLPEGADVKMVRIIPRGSSYVAEIVYGKEVNVNKRMAGCVLGVDIGLENVMTVVDDQGNRPWIVKGGALKSMNQYYNKELARLRSICARSGQRTTKRIKRLSEKRNRKVRNALHHMSKLLVWHACRVGASSIVIGYNEGWKQNIKLGRRTNQGFVQIPYHTLLKQIAYKSEENGIEVVLQDESYTSMCSFLDGEPIERHGSYKGRRICRGLFQSEKGKVINADVNAAYNIIKKAFPKVFAEGIEDVSLHPVRMAMCPVCE